jgi:hypothetical protein
LRLEREPRTRLRAILACTGRHESLDPPRQIDTEGVDILPHVVKGLRSDSGSGVEARIVWANRAFSSRKVRVSAPSARLACSMSRG